MGETRIVPPEEAREQLIETQLERDVARIDLATTRAQLEEARSQIEVLKRHHEIDLAEIERFRAQLCESRPRQTANSEETCSALAATPGALVSRCTYRDEDREEWEERLRRSFLVARDAGYFLQCRECETGFELSDDLGPAHQLRRALHHAREHAERSR